MGNTMDSSPNMWIYIIFVVSTVTSLISACANCTRQEILGKLFSKNTTYDPMIAPDYEKDHPTNVTVQIYVNSLDSLTEESMDFSVDVFLRQRWVDTRLLYTPPTKIKWLELDQKMIERVWVPDTFFPNEKTGDFHDITVPNRLMHLYPNGTVFYSIRLRLTLSCDMKLQTYPLDVQRCPINIESYSYTTENVVFYWYKHLPIKIPVSTLPQFTFDPIPVLQANCTKNYGEADFSCLKATIHLSRNTGYYIAQIFIPSILITGLSWVSFWVDAEATPARISLGVLTVLTITTQSSGARSSLPRVSYIKAIDVWMATCLIFVFAALLEFAYINVLTRKTRSIFMPSLSIGPDGLLTESTKRPSNSGDFQYIDFTKNARAVDKVSRFVFPFLFIVFNLVFWIYYLTAQY